MFGIPLIEWVGYAASIMIAASLVMTSIVWLRIINTIGCILFVIYGFTVGAYPVGIVNAFIIIVNLYYLYKMYSDKQK